MGIHELGSHEWYRLLINSRQDGYHYIGFARPPRIVACWSNLTAGGALP